MGWVSTCPESHRQWGDRPGFFHSPVLWLGASWQNECAWGTHRVGRSALSVSISMEHSCRPEEPSQTFHPTWGTAAGLFLFTEHAPSPQSRLTALPSPGNLWQQLLLSPFLRGQNRGSKRPWRLLGSYSLKLSWSGYVESCFPHLLVLFQPVVPESSRAQEKR